jgi:predicted nucleotide-binding protein
MPSKRPLAKKYRIMICDDSEQERQRFYARQFDNFKILGVTRHGKRFTETDPLDSVDKLYQRILRLRKKCDLPDLILLDLFYRKPLPNINTIEQQFIAELLVFKQRFLRLKRKVLEHLDATGISVLQRIREIDHISAAELPIAVYTDKNFNFLPSDQFNLLYKLDAETVHKDRDDDPNTQISPSAEYLRLLHTIEHNRNSIPNWKNTIFISHGRSTAWNELQTFLKRAQRPTMELAQRASRGHTVITKLAAAAEHCSHAVIVMTCDDVSASGAKRVRENVMHEIGYFQGRLGLNRVVLLREQGVSMPSNLGGIVYLSFRRGKIAGTFKQLLQEFA